jgi:hypothetical protein
MPLKRFGDITNLQGYMIDADGSCFGKVCDESA